MTTRLGLATALILTTIPLTAQTWIARASDNYRPDRRGGRFDLRVYVNGSAEFEIRGNQIRVVNGNARRIRDDGSEYNAEIPRGRMLGLRLDQRDGRNDNGIQIVQEPNPRNGYALRLRINDRRRGDDSRYHARITWDDVQYDRFSDDRGGWNRGRGNDRWGRDDDRWGRDRDNRDFGWGSGGAINWSGRNVPSSLVGEFQGRSRETGEPMDLRISSNGRLEGFSQAGRFDGEARDGVLRIGENRFMVELTGRGFRTIERGNPSNVSEYWRR